MSEMYRSHDVAMVEMFKSDPELALDLLNSILQEGDQGELMVTLRQVSRAFSSMRQVAGGVSQSIVTHRFCV